MYMQEETKKQQSDTEVLLLYSGLHAILAYRVSHKLYLTEHYFSARAVSQMCGGNGGGRPDSAASGAKDAAKIPEAIAAVPSIVEGMLK